MPKAAERAMRSARVINVSVLTLRTLHCNDRRQSRHARARRGGRVAAGQGSLGSRSLTVGRRRRQAVEPLGHRAMAEGPAKPRGELDGRACNHRDREAYITFLRGSRTCVSNRASLLNVVCRGTPSTHAAWWWQARPVRAAVRALPPALPRCGRAIYNASSQDLRVAIMCRRPALRSRSACEMRVVHLMSLRS